MEKKLKYYLNYYEKLTVENLEGSKKEEISNNLLTLISFFQHERLIHLLVTLSFAILTVLSVLGCCFIESLTVYILTALFVILLIPYIRHYYILENGVQKLYSYYEKLIGTKK